ncbi:MAG TPA: DUF4339 domain-containing protein [Verrucomicrobiota bacterium]|nr:DUF4339 domain-containing protein [Verrucomicrobiota bacterium]
MTWFYVRDHQIVGPIEPEEFNARVDEGVIGPDTLVWGEGLATWTPWSQVQPPVQSASAAPPFGTRDVSVSVGQIWPVAWEWFQRQPWKVIGLIIGTTLLIALVELASLALNFILPVASSLAAALVVGPLQTGVLLMLLVWIRGGRLELATVWRCFGPRYWPLALGQMVLQVVFTVVGLITAVGLVPMLLVAYKIGQDPESLPPAIALSALLIGGAVGMVGVIVYFYLAVAWLFAPLLILDKGLDFWPAMKLSRRIAYLHPWGFSWFLLVVSTFAFAGILLFGIGLAVTLPLGALMLVLAYEQQFGDLPSVNHEPTKG